MTNISPNFINFQKGNHSNVYDYAHGVTIRGATTNNEGEVTIPLNVKFFVLVIHFLCKKND